MKLGGHHDFEAFKGDAPTPGLVAPELGADQKPVYASHCEAVPDRTRCPYGQMTTSRADFDEWYRATPGVNRSYLVYLSFIEPGQTYALDLFHAERHSYASNFRVDTTLAFTECGQVM